jgi:putative FmdB family regulatory protein
MPIYDYICTKCGHEVEVIHSVAVDGPSVCPKCGGPMKKAIVAPAVHFKGSGWARKERPGSEKSSARTAPPVSGAGSDEGSAKPAAGPTESAKVEQPAKDAD